MKYSVETRLIRDNKNEAEAWQLSLGNEAEAWQLSLGNEAEDNIDKLKQENLNENLIL